jgi:hypothetical protein
VNQRASPKRSGFRPSRRLLGSRFGKRWSSRFRWEWCWRTRVMGRAHHFVRISRNSDCHRSWAWSLTPPSGNQGHSPGPYPRANQVGVGPPSACRAKRVIRPFR